jgi:hypothetical protein
MSARATLDIPAVVADVLATGIAIDGCKVRITRQLDRDLYQKVDKVLQACGGRWNRSARAHVFEADPTERLQVGQQTGQVDRLIVKYQMYETPTDLATEMVSRLRLHHIERMLEPSAGRGRLVLPALRAGAKVTAIELWDANLPALHELTDWVSHADFLAMKPIGRLFDAIAMNPPFAKQQGIAHIEHAYTNWLAPGGRMVALCDAGALTNGSGRAKQFQRWIRERAVEVTDLPDGSFVSSGTRVAAKMLFARKAGRA